MNKLIEQLWGALSSSGNQFLSGGLMLGIIGSLGYWLKSLPERLWSAFLYHFTVRLEVLNTDQAYQWVLVWMESQPYTAKARRIALRDVQMKNRHSDDKSFIVPARGNHWFFYKGLPIWLHRGKDDGASQSNPNKDMSSMIGPKEVISIRTIGRNRDRINQIIEEAQALYERVTLDRLVVKYRRWGDWEVRLRDRRPLTSVFLDRKEEVVKDIKRFLDSKKWYHDMGLPYRRGYLFYGIAGSGKSTLTEALAAEFELEIYIINLASVDDSQLEQAILDMDHDKPVILLLEDVDTVVSNRDDAEAPAKSRENRPMSPTQPQMKLRLGTLLNVLDGLTSTDKLLLVMTTNHPDRLDPALKRRGRVDMSIEFGYASDAQIEQAIDRFLGAPTEAQQAAIAKWARPITMCDVQENLRQLIWESFETDTVPESGIVQDRDLGDETDKENA